MIADLQLEDKRNVPSANLSGGMKRKLRWAFWKCVSSLPLHVYITAAEFDHSTAPTDLTPTIMDHATCSFADDNQHRNIFSCLYAEPYALYSHYAGYTVCLEITIFMFYIIRKLTGRI